MLEPNELLAYYNYWVNGETLSRWQLLFDRPPAPPAAPQAGLPFSEDNPTQLTLLSTSGSNQLPLKVDTSKLEPIYQILLHGSQATADACDFSDVDVLIVLDDLRTFSTAQHHIAMSELRILLKSMFLYDCLMHHGFMFMPRSAFGRYEESFLPIDTLRNARAIHGPRSIALTKSTPVQTKQRLQSAVESLAQRLERRDHERDDFAFKSVLSGLLLMPSLLLASVDIFRYKRDSFSLGPQAFPNLHWAAIRHGEELRSRWKRPAARLTQRAVSKMAHPHTIIRLSRFRATRTNVRLLLGDQSDAFTQSCQQFLAGLVRV